MKIAIQQQHILATKYVPYISVESDLQTILDKVVHKYIVLRGPFSTVTNKFIDEERCSLVIIWSRYIAYASKIKSSNANIEKMLILMLYWKIFSF